MPGEHNATQKLLGFWCDPDFLDEIDRARGTTPRSQFMRDALMEKLASLGIVVPKEKTVAPDRTGKGGRKRYPEDSGARSLAEDSSRRTPVNYNQVPRSRPDAAHDKPVSSKVRDARRALAASAAAKAKTASPGRGRKSKADGSSAGKS